MTWDETFGCSLGSLADQEGDISWILHSSEDRSIRASNYHIAYVLFNLLEAFCISEVSKFY